METYTFDAENRMTGISSYPTNTSYAYDGQGNLAVRSTTASPRTGAIDDRTTYAGGVYEERSEYGIGINAKATLLYQAFGHVIATRTGTETTYLLADHLGSTVGTVSADGSDVHQVRYWPYGKVRSGGVGTDKMYTGQQMEAGGALGAYFYHARFYSTALGRFVSADSVTLDGLNRYRYVANNPVNARDSSGKASRTGLLDGMAESESLTACLQNVSACLWWSAQGNENAYYGLVAGYFGVSPALLFAIVQNQAANWKVVQEVLGLSVDDIQAGLAKGMAIGDIVTDSVSAHLPFPLSQVPDLLDGADAIQNWISQKVAELTGLQIDPNDPSLGIGQIRISTAQTLMPGASIPQLVDMLMSFQGAVFLAGANLSHLATTVLGTTPANASKFDLIALYRIGDRGFNEAASEHGCGSCGPIGRDEIQRVWPLYVDAIKTFGE